jgi:hypothetical protein
LLPQLSIAQEIEAATREELRAVSDCDVLAVLNWQALRAD